MKKRERDPQRVQVILEAGLNHNGSLETAIKMVDAANKAGADVIKFQTYTCEKLLQPGHPDWDALKELELSREDFVKIAQYCGEIGIEFMSTPGDLDSLDFLVNDLKVKRIKIGSDDLFYKPLLYKAISSGRPVIVSTGMASLTDIGKALPTNFYGKVTLLHCVSLYPCPPEKANLNAMRKLKWFGCPVGYSDHVPGIQAAVAAATLGACIIEKHVMLSNDSQCIDAAVSVTFKQAHDMIKQIRLIESMMGDGETAHYTNVILRERYCKGPDGLRSAYNETEAFGSNPGQGRIGKDSVQEHHRAGR